MDEVEAPDEEPSGTVPCPECGKQFNPRGLGLHRARAHGYRAGDGNGAPPRGPRTQRLDQPPRIDLVLEEHLLVESLSMMGMYMMAPLPHTGLTIVTRAGERSIEVPGQEQPIKRKGIAATLMEYGKRDPRILRAIVRFNALMHGGETIELAMSLGAAVAVDIHAVDPHMAIPIPGAPDGAAIEPIMALIPDVVMQVEADREAAGIPPADMGGGVEEPV